METSWSDIISNTAMLLIDDVRWDEGLSINPAQYYRSKSLYVMSAIPMMNRPPELLTYLKEGMVVPTYDDFSWESTSASLSSQTQVSTGKTGYELCSVSYYSEDGTEMYPYSGFSYNSTTGVVTFDIQSNVGIQYSIDFYTDGKFRELTETQKRLIGLGIACVWDERFERNWLNIQMKIKDSSFSTVNEANYIEKSNARKIENRKLLSSELRKYEQDTAYRRVVREQSSVMNNFA